MLALYHGCCDPSPNAIQAGTQLTDSRDYAEYVGRALARAAGRTHCYVHELEADHHEIAYVGREPLADANIYRLKADVPVMATVQRGV